MYIYGSYRKIKIGVRFYRKIKIGVRFLDHPVDTYHTTHRSKWTPDDAPVVEYHGLPAHQNSNKPSANIPFLELLRATVSNQCCYCFEIEPYRFPVVYIKCCKHLSSKKYEKNKINCQKTKTWYAIIIASQFSVSTIGKKLSKKRYG